MTSRDRYDSLFQYYAGRHGLDWRWLKAQVAVESNYNPKAESPVGAQGLTQFMPATWAEIAPPGADPFNPESAIDAQAKYMAQLLARFDDDPFQALAAYNWGMGRVQQAITLAGAQWQARLPEETRTYLRRVRAARAALEEAPEP